MGRQDTALDATGPMNQNRNMKNNSQLYLVNYVTPLTRQRKELEKICTIITISPSPEIPTIEKHKMPDSPHIPSNCPCSQTHVHFATPIATKAHTTMMSEPANKYAHIASSPPPPPTKSFTQRYWKHTKCKRATTNTDTRYTKHQLKYGVLNISIP